MDVKELVMQGIKVDTRAVPMPEWGEGVVIHLRTITAFDRDKFEVDLVPLSGFEDMSEADKNADIKRRTGNMSARWLAMCICDPETGDRLFVTDEEIEKLGEVLGDDIDMLRKKSEEINGITNDIEDLAKNLEAEASAG